MKMPFQATVVRYVHDVLTGEFVNVGIVLVSTELGYVGASFISHWARVTATFPNAELPHLRRIAHVIGNACVEAQAHAGQTCLLREATDIIAFLSGVIPRDDAAIQFSPVVRGVTDDPARTLAELRERYAEKYVPEFTGRETRNESQIWQDFLKRLARRPELLRHLVPHTLQSPKSPGFRQEFDKAWMNGKWNIAQPVSLDMLDARVIRDKAAHWVGRIIALHPSDQNALVLFLVGMPPGDVPDEIRQAAAEAVEILQDHLEGEAQVFTEDHSDELVAKLEHDVAFH